MKLGFRKLVPSLRSTKQPQPAETAEQAELAGGSAGPLDDIMEEIGDLLHQMNFDAPAEVAPDAAAVVENLLSPRFGLEPDVDDDNSAWSDEDAAAEAYTDDAEYYDNPEEDEDYYSDDDQAGEYYDDDEYYVDDSVYDDEDYGDDNAEYYEADATYYTENDSPADAYSVGTAPPYYGESALAKLRKALTMKLFTLRKTLNMFRTRQRLSARHSLWREQVFVATTMLFTPTKTMKLPDLIPAMRIQPTVPAS